MEIACLGLEQVEGFDWCVTPVVEYCERDLITEKNPWGIATAELFEGELQLYDASGVIIDTQRMSQLAHSYLAMRPPDLGAKQDEEAIVHPVTCTIQNDMPELYFKKSTRSLCTSYAINSSRDVQNYPKVSAP